MGTRCVRCGIFPVFPEPGKGERASVFHGDRERQLRFSRFPPFVKSVRGNQAAAFCESTPEGGGLIDSLSSRINGPISRSFDVEPEASPAVVRTFPFGLTASTARNL
jgi:hypothetical protein